MDPLSQILAGLEGAAWLLSWAPPMPLDPEMAHVQLAAGGAAVLVMAGAMMVEIV